MIAANPNRVGAGFKIENLLQIVELVNDMVACKIDGGVIQVVNYNVKGQQYVVAGDRTSLEALRQSLNGIKQGMLTPDQLNMGSVVQAACEATLKTADRPGGHPMTRGVATIPLPGIDVPFHSRFLLGGVEPFRYLLQDACTLEACRAADLEKRYIPNLTGKLFEVTREYTQHTYNLTQSPYLKSLLSDWDSLQLDAPDTSHKAEAMRILVIELLAYQFASPVQWIDTQEVLFKELEVRRCVPL